ncbi:hypothetical protein ACYUJ6_10605 [Clostridium sp. JNZ X4-2]
MILNNTFKNQNSKDDSFDISVSINYKITIDDNIKKTNPNIIKATKQAIFDTDCYFAKLQHYNRYFKDNDIFIFNVKKTGENTWEVDFKEKKSGTKLLPVNG